ncbi:hypothetical protein [Streptomyces sp. NBC_01353]|uniref:hypothetical protein n=1 Tax=Streptomyces sp. NBC_01353 TaxID=2903835 RepID=UPI002E334CD8|nr:hypothetical protein [Streptomyces sp. NBC_01353]
MSGHLTDRDERMWQRRAEERVAEPLPISAWIRGLGTVLARRRETGRRAATRLHPCEPSWRPGTPVVPKAAGSSSG